MPKILAVDDLPLHLDYLQEELSRLDYEVVTAQNGQVALKLIDEGAPDLVLLDLSMPGMDGLQVLQILRADRTHRSLPVIMLTARKDYEDRIAGLDAGADDYVTKPFHIGEVAARINALLRIRDLQQQVLKSEKQLAQLRGITQTMVASLHHVNNATQSISRLAQLAIADPNDKNIPAQLRDVALRQSEKISAVLDSMQHTIESMKVHTTDYAGEPNRMIDIEEDLRRRFDEIDAAGRDNPLGPAQ